MFNLQMRGTGIARWCALSKAVVRPHFAFAIQRR